MALKKKTYINGQTVISAENLNDIQDEIIGTKTANGTVVSQNADFAEVAEWEDGNPNNEDRTGYFVCANVPLNGIVMKKATSLDDVKGVSILTPAFAGNYTADKLDSKGNLLPKYSFVAVLGFVPVRDNGTCAVGGRCMPDDNGCAIPSSNSMGYQVVNRIDENRVLIIIEPNGDMVQRIKTRVNKMQEDIDNLAPDQTYSPESENAQSGKAVAEAVSSKADLEKWELINSQTLTEAAVVSFTDLNLKKFKILAELPQTGTALTVWLQLNNRCAMFTEASRADAKGPSFSIEGDYTYDWQFSTALNNTNATALGTVMQVPYGHRYVAGGLTYPCEKIVIGLNSTVVTPLPTGAKVTLWGVRA